MREHPRDNFTGLCSVSPAMKCNLMEVKTPRGRGKARPKLESLCACYRCSFMRKYLNMTLECKLGFAAELAKAYKFCMKSNAFLL